MDYNINVTSFELKNNTLTITYNGGEHATYHFSGHATWHDSRATRMQPTNTGNTFSNLTVVKAPAHEEVAHHHIAPELTLPFVGFDAHHHHDFGHHLFG